MTNTWPLQKDCPSFYGDPASHGWEAANMTTVPCPWPLNAAADDPSNKGPSHIYINKKCADSLVRVLNVIWTGQGQDLAKIKSLRYDKFSGSYNYRPMRGSHLLSMHAYGCAIDWDADDNEFHHTQHLFTDDSPLVVAFKSEGWVWGGDWSPGSVDAMHVQAARIHP